MSKQRVEGGGGAKCFINIISSLFLFSKKIMVFGAGIHKMFVRLAKRVTLVRLQKMSDLGWLYLSFGLF